MKRLPACVCSWIVAMVILGLTGGCSGSDFRVVETRYVERNRNTHYLTDDDGNVVLDVPPPILRSVLDQLSAKGDARTVKAVQDLYDIETGRVHDEEHARSIDRLLSTMRKERQ
jgi:hypothetical protein